MVSALRDHKSYRIGRPLATFGRRLERRGPGAETLTDPRLKMY